MANPIEAISARDGAAITASDSTVVAFDAIYVGTTGDVAVTTSRGSVVTFATVPAGTILPIKVTRVMSTNTTAAAMIGLRY
jgi:hypothetical protein